MFFVVLELGSQKPVFLSEHRRHDDAVAACKRAALHFRSVQGRASVVSRDSADQLQVSQKRRVVRDQPELAAVGEDITILADATPYRRSAS